MQYQVQPVSHRQVTLPGGRILGYAQYGDPGGTPVLYFHGGLSCRIDIAFAHEQCAILGIRLIAPDRPGIGMSERLPHRTLLNWARDVGNLADALNLSRFPVLGWSLGGPYALACAYELADRITRAGTIGGVGPMDRPGSIQELGMLEDHILLTCPPNMRWVLALGLEALAKLPAAVVNKSLETHLTSPSDLEIVRSFTHEQGSAFFFESMKRGGMGHLDDYAAVAPPWDFQVEKVTTEVLLWQGDEDNICPVSAARALRPRLPNAKLLIVPNHGHFLLYRKLTEVMEALLA